MSQSVTTAFQPSITEWFAAIGEVEESNAFREEDNAKVDRLEKLYQEIALPYEQPEEFAARDLFDRSPAFEKILAERGSELCAIRLVPKKSGLPKLRNRGLSIKECYETWLLKQAVNPDEYIAYLCPHSETLLWSAIFIVNQEVIFGEVIKGLHAQLTHGDTNETLNQFLYDFNSWQWTQNDSRAQEQIQRMINLIRVFDEKKQKRLREELGAQFFHNYLAGYFEVTIWPNDRVYFIDYNRLLPKYITQPPRLDRAKANEEKNFSGITGCSGVARGPAVIVDSENLSSVDFPEGAVLVCDNTDVRYLPLMRKAAAIVTDRGGMLSHASIVSRELGKPCLIGTKIATKVLKDGDLVEVDAEKGIVKKI